MKILKERPHVFWFGLAVLMLAAETILFSSIWTSFAASEQWSIHTHQVLERIESLLSELKDAETGQRGYLLTGEDRYLEPYETGTRAIPGQLDELRKLTLLDQRNRESLSTAHFLIALMGGGAAFLLIVLLAGSFSSLEPRSTGGRGKERPWPIAYGAAVLATLVAFALRLALTPLVGPTALPFTIFFPAVLVAAWFGGFRAGALTTLLSALASSYYFTEPVGMLAVRNRQDQIELLIFIAVGLGIAWLSHLQRKAVQRADSAEGAEREQRQYFETTLASIGDGVIVTDRNGRLTMANPVAAQLTGWPPGEAQNQPLETVFPIVNEQTGKQVENPALRAIREGRIVGLANHTILISRDSRRIPLDDSGAPIIDASGNVLGAVLIFRDVSEKRAREAEVRRRDRMLMFSLDAIVITDAERRIQFWNRGAAELYGWGEAEVIGKVTHALLRTSPSIAGVDEILAREGQWSGELTHTCKDGRVATVESRELLLRNAEGAVDGILQINRDITERKRAEEELAWLASFPERNTAPVTEVELPTGVVHYANSATWRLFPEMRQQGFSHPYLAGLEQIAGTLAEGNRASVVREVMVGDRCFTQLVAYVAEKQWLRIYGFDITDRKQAEEALAASESRFRALLDSASQGVVAVNEEGRMVLVNARTEEMFGYTRDELLGQPLEILLPERFRAAHGEHLRHYFAHPYTRMMGLGMDLWGRSRNGSEIPVEISLSCIEQGGSRLAMALITDTTERKKGEDRLRESQKLESLGLLAGGVAHDFNNLLVGVIGNASLAQEMLPPDSPAVELLKGVVQSGEQAAHLTRQMLAYSGKGKFMVEPLDLSALIPGMTGLVQPSIPKKIALHLDLEPDLPAIEADRGQVQQVLMNLVINAGEAIGSQEGRITVRTSALDVDGPYLRLHPDAVELRPGRYVCLEVSDSGSGMDEETKAKIFDPFFTTKFTGRGLGLAAVAGVVRGHRGGITVSSAPGKGSCFTVLFPAIERAVEEPPAVAPNIETHSTGVVLVVDDEPVVREMAKKALERQGYTVLLADSGLAAIEAFRKYTGEIALVLLDLSMPNMGGDEALPELRKRRPEIKVMVSSGYSEAETMTLFRGQRVSCFIQKPYTAKELAEKVNACIG